MRAKAGLGGVAAGAVPVAEQRVQPAVAVAALGKVVDQLDMAVAVAERFAGAVEIELASMARAAAGRIGAARPRVPAGS